ncbi:MAG: hypothetical protein IJJ00_05955 [Erysipelotrichaceae bacterium]|nr:hypothetical protein [Erysipelotrichaceae bacterium]
MKNIAPFMSIGFTVIGTFLLAYLIGVKTGHLGAALVIGAVLCVVYIIDLIRRELK